MSLFPVELYITILLQLSGRDLCNYSTKTVVSFLSANSVTRSAALDRSVWEHLYRSRYTHNEPEHETERHIRLKGDWQSMYIERFTLDRATLQTLDYIRIHPEDRRSVVVEEFTKSISLDVYDALELEADLPVARVFRDPAMDDMDEESVHEALPRRFWAKATLGALLRIQSINTWCSVNDQPHDHTIEELLTALSAFADVPASQIVNQFDELAARCRQKLVSEGLELDREARDYVMPRLIVSIRDFMHSVGFAIGEGTSFYHSYNQFPHFFLDTGRSHTLPMSMACIFCAICSRLNIQAAPTNTPHRILCYVTSSDPLKGDILFDPGDDSPPIVFSSREPSVMLLEAGLPSHLSADAVRPASMANLLVRVSNNIFATMHRAQTDQLGHGAARAEYAVTCALFTVNPGFVPTIPSDCPLDEWIVVTNVLAPLLPAAMRRPFLRTYEFRASNPELGAKNPSRYLDYHSPRLRPKPGSAQTEVVLKVFIGGVVSHPHHGLGCIVGWQDGERVASVDAVRPSIVCAIITESGVHACSEDPACMGDPEEDEFALEPQLLTPSKLIWLRKHIYQFERFFEDAYIPREDGLGGRLIPTAELRVQYPDDLEAGTQWSEEQLKGTSSTGQQGMILKHITMSPHSLQRTQLYTLP
ncbi:hypothetical protein C8Q80DRAFT_57509 [Daedaleopsis nitida]|nr:hypothetical protein C8Q80DRAFT_57509 [Daedaleopsis nitida]